MASCGLFGLLNVFLPAQRLSRNVFLGFRMLVKEVAVAGELLALALRQLCELCWWRPGRPGGASAMLHRASRPDKGRQPQCSVAAP